MSESFALIVRFEAACWVGARSAWPVIQAEIDAKSALRGGHETQTYAMGSSWVRTFPFHQFSSGPRSIPLRFAIPLAYGVCSSIGMGPSFSQLLVNHEAAFSPR